MDKERGMWEEGRGAGGWILSSRNFSCAQKRCFLLGSEEKEKLKRLIIKFGESLPRSRSLHVTVANKTAIHFDDKINPENETKK